MRVHGRGNRTAHLTCPQVKENMTDLHEIRMGTGTRTGHRGTEATTIDPRETEIMIDPRGIETTIDPQGTEIMIELQGTGITIDPQGTGITIDPQGIETIMTGLREAETPTAIQTDHHEIGAMETGHHQGTEIDTATLGVETTMDVEAGVHQEGGEVPQEMNPLRDLD